MLETKGSIYRFERGLREVASMWHPHRCHKGDSWSKGKSHGKVNISLLGERDGSRFSHTCEKIWRKEMVTSV